MILAALDSGDIVYPFYRYIENPVTLRFKEGFVDEVLGDGLDAKLIRDYFSHWNDPSERLVGELLVIETLAHNEVINGTG